MNSADPGAFLEEIAQEFGDIQAAWRFAVTTQNRDEIRRIAEGFLIFYDLRSWYEAGSDAIALYQQALDFFEGHETGPGQRSTIACLCESLNHLYKLSGTYDQAMVYCQRALEQIDPTDFVRQGRQYRQIADVYVITNEHNKADASFTEASAILDQAVERDSAWWQEWAYIQSEQLYLYYWANRLDDMIALDRKARVLVEEHGTLSARSLYATGVSAMANRRDRFFNSTEALVATREGLAISYKAGNLSGIAQCHFRYGFNCLWNNLFDESEKHLRIAQKMSEQSGDLILLARILAYMSVAQRKLGNIENVRAYATYGFQIAQQTHMPQYTGIARAEYAWIAWREADDIETLHQVEAAIEDWGGLG
jgi:tetratricopeptide (TPR) repeat protein